MHLPKMEDAFFYAFTHLSSTIIFIFLTQSPVEHSTQYHHFLPTLWYKYPSHVVWWGFFVDCTFVTYKINDTKV